MKKFSLFLSALLFSMMSFAAGATMAAGTNGSTCTVNGTDGIKVGTSKKGGDMTITVPAGATELSFYAGAWKGVTGLSVNITPADKLLTSSIALTADEGLSNNPPFTLKGDEASYLFTITLQNITTETTFKLEGSSAKRFVVWGATCTVGASEDFVAAPSISGDVDFVESTIISITALDGLNVYYTVDGTDPTNESAAYTAPFEITETTTVKAIAYNGDKASAVAEKTFKKLQVLTCADAAALCTTTETTDKYVIRGYVTALVNGGYSEDYKNSSFWIADTEDGGKVLEAYAVDPINPETDILVKVGDYVEVIGKLVLYGSYKTPEVNRGTYTIIEAPAKIEPCAEATPVNWDDKIELEANADKWYLMDLTTAIEAGKDLEFHLVNTSADSVVVTVEAHDACPTDEFTLLQSSTQTIEANASKSKVLGYADFLAGQVEQMYIHVITKGGALDLGMETAKYTVTVTAENGTVAGAGTFEDGDTITLTATPAEGYEFVNWTVADSIVSIENPYTFVVTADVALVANFKKAAPATETVYFINTKKWSAVKAHAWGGTAAGTSWPGLATVKEAEKIANYDVYSFTAKAGAYKNVIFNNNNGGSQTADLVWTAGKYYVIDMGWLTKEEAEAKLATPIPDVWTVVGAKGLLGTDWNLNDANNNMTLQADGTYQLVKTDIVLAAGNYDYKAAKDHAWTTSVPQSGNQTLKITTSGTYDVTFVLNVTTKKLTATATLKQEEVIIPTIQVAGDMTSWGDAPVTLVMAADSLTATATIKLDAKTYEFKMIVGGNWQSDAKTVNRDNNSTVFTGANSDTNTKLVADQAGDYIFTWTYETKTLTVTYPALIEWIPMDLEIANLATEVIEAEGAKYLLLQGRDDMNDADVMLFLNNYADVDDDYEVNAESSFMTFGGMELTVLEGVMTQTSETDKGTIYTGTVRASVEEEGETMYVEFALTMYAAPATVIELTDAIVAINEELGTLTFNVATGEGEGYYAELAGYTAPGVHEGPQICLFMTPEVVAYTNYAETSVADGVITLKGEFVSPMGPKFDVTISGKLPKTEPVEKPEPTYTENQLNTYAFGLESELTEEALNVTYRLNNSNATSVNVLVYKGEEVVATVAGTTTIGVNTVVIPVAELPAGVQLTWAVEVNGTSVEVPTLEEKIYSFYHPSGVDVDNNPENPTFGLLLTNEAMQSVASKTDGYVSAQFGAGIFAFTPSFDLIPNGDQPGYNGGKTFSTVKNDFAPRRIRISNDGRIFATAQDGSGEYLWEINPANLNEWTTVFQGTNDGYTLKDAEGNFIAGTNSGFDVRGEGENLQLLMLSASLPGAQVASFKCHTYDLGTATTWATAPTKEIPGANYMLVTNQSNAQFDKDGGVWYIQYRGTTTESEPGLVHINKDGVEDLKQLRHYTRNAGFRFTDDFSKVIIAGVTDGSNVRKATIYAVSQDENGAPVLTEETVIETSVLGSNLNDFAWDYAGNLYGVSNSNEKLAAWAMPYSGQVVTPAASKYAFQIGEPVEPVEIVGVVKRAVQNGDAVIVLTHEADGTAHIYEVVDGVAVAELSQEGVIAVDPENKGSYLAISDIAVTEDGKLVANNYVRNQFAGTTPEAGYLVGTSYYYIWNDLHDAPSVWFTSQTTARSSHGDVGVTFALKGTSTNAELLVTAVHNNNRAVRLAKYNIIDGQYVEPNIPGGQQSSEYYEYFGTHTKEAYYQEAVQGKQFQLNVSPLGDNNWIMDGELVDPSEFVLPGVGENYAASATLTEDLGKKYNGATYVTVGEKVLMVAPFVHEVSGLLAGVKVLDITAGLDAATVVTTSELDIYLDVTAAATAVQVVEGGLNITLVADNAIQTWFVELSEGPVFEVYEDEITNLVIDLDNLVLIGGPSSAFQVDVYLPLGEYNMSEDSYQLLPESSIAVMGSDATFIEGYAYEVDAFTPSAKAVVRCDWNGMLLEFHLTMTAEPMEATVVVVEDAMVEIEKYQIWGDMYDYALTMTGEWVNPEDGLTYPVLVEIPVYYPEATEPSEIMSTVTVGGWGDEDPWLGFGEGTLTVTTVDGVVTATGIVQNPMAGVAIDITISGKLPQEPVKYTVTATVNPAEAGTVEGAGEYEENAEATLIATAAEGYEFVNWTVAGEEVSTDATYTFTVTADVEVVANFKAKVGSGVANIQTGVNAVKTIKNGQLIITKDGKEYNAQGAILK